MVEVRNNEQRRRYEILDGLGVAGFAQYVIRPGRVILVHTEIDPAFEGRGLGSKLAAGALDDIRSRGLRVVPLCPFIEAYIESHPEYQDLVDRDAVAALARKY
ncbi:MAG TPA: GNAT family N-acetyltransferase [Acidimicrobiia bacterium]|nr:GNAT family N-acetyltransferase [Acidimicrobiia bacterium]